MLDETLSTTGQDSVDAQREAARLEALDRYDLLDGQSEPAFGRIARLIRNIFGIDIAIVSVVDGHRQLYQAAEGIETTEAARQETFCRYTILQDRPLVVADAAKDSRFRDNPYVSGAPGIRFYAGVPLRTGDGHNIGTVCAIDGKPREFSRKDLAILQDIADLTMEQIELRQLAMTDALTGALSRRAFMEEGSRAMALARRQKSDLSVIVFDVDHFKAVNDTFGHAMGDTVLRELTATCRAILRDTDVFGRLGGEEFAVLLHGGRAGAMETAERLRMALEGMRLTSGALKVRITASFGIAALDGTANSLDDVLQQADAALYFSKRSGRNRCSTWQSPDVATVPVRRRVLKAGQILFNNRMSTIDCTVRSLGSDGASLDVTSTSGIPAKFTLSVKSDRLDVACRIVSQTEKSLEVEFV